MLEGCGIGRLDLIYTERALLRPPSGLNRYPRLPGPAGLSNFTQSTQFLGFGKDPTVLAAIKFNIMLDEDVAAPPSPRGY